MNRIATNNLLAAGVLCVPFANPAIAESIEILNHSFELPQVTPDPDSQDPSNFVSDEVLFWDEFGPVSSFAGFSGTLDSGVFANVSSEFLPAVGNADGPQDPFNQLGFMQVNDTTNGTTVPYNAIAQQTDGLFAQDLEYTFSLAVGPSTTDPAGPGATLVLELGYYMPNGDALDFVGLNERVIDSSELKDPYDSALLSDPDYPLLQDFDVTVDASQITSDAINEQIVVKVTQVGGNSGGFILDNARLDVVPEPGSLALLTLAGTMLLRRRRPAA